MIAACVLPRLAATCVGIVAIERAVGVVAGGASSSRPSPHARLCDASDGALARGVRPGQRIVDAQRCAPDLQVVAVDVAGLTQALHGVAEQLYRHAPACEPVAPAERACLPFFAVVVDLAGLPRPPARTLAELAAAVAQTGHRAVVAASSSRALSLAVARDMAARPSRWGRAQLVIDDRGPERLAVRTALRTRLAVEALELDRDVVDDLRAAGVACAQDLVPLLRSGLVERLGVAAQRVRPVLVDAADLDDVDDLVVPWRPPELVVVARELEHAVTALEPLLFVLRPLAEDVLRRLDARGARLLELTVALRRQTAAPTELIVGFPAAVTAVDVVVRVLQARLERAFAQQRVGHDGVRGLVLRASRTTPARARQLEGLGSPPSSGSSSGTTAASLAAAPLQGAIADLCAEFSAELGEGRVGCLHPTRAALPEHMTALLPPGVAADADDDRVAGSAAAPRRGRRPVTLDPRTAHGRFAAGWPWPLSMLPTPVRLASLEAVVDERLFCQLDGVDDDGPYEREYRVVVFADGRRALCVWDAETSERFLCGWFD
ncbi:MAG: hypothetical protein FJ137_03660 [Deltaproteobacteria bacterium]|nr:hypothetical protein [Deltaproteobacteria bacterium]